MPRSNDRLPRCSPLLCALAIVGLTAGAKAAPVASPGDGALSLAWELRAFHNVVTMALSPDNRWLAALTCVSEGEEPYGLCDVVLWDIRHPHRQRRLPMPKGGLAYADLGDELPLAFSPDSRTLALVGWSLSARCRSYLQPADKNMIDHCGAAQDEKAARLRLARWDLGTGQALASIPVSSKLPPRGLSFDKAGDHAIISLHERDDEKARPRVVTLELSTGKAIRSRQLSAATQIVHHPGGGYVVDSGPDKHTLVIADLATGKRLAHLSHVPSGAHAVRYSEEAAKVAVVTRRQVTFYTIPSSAAASSPLDLRALPRFRIAQRDRRSTPTPGAEGQGDDCCHSFAGWAGFAPGGRTFVAQADPGRHASAAHCQRIFAIMDVKEKKMVNTMTAEKFSNPPFISPDGASVLIDRSYYGNSEHGFRLGDIHRHALPSGRLLQRFEGIDGVPGTLRISPEGRRVAVGSRHSIWYGFPVRELELASGRVVERYPLDSGCYYSQPERAAEMSYAGRSAPRCAQLHQEGESVPGWIREPGNSENADQERFPCQNDYCSVNARSPDGRWLAVGCDTGHLVLWRWGRWMRPVRVLNRPGEVDAVSFSPDSAQVVVASEVQRRRNRRAPRVLLATYSLPRGRRISSVLLESRTRDEDLNGLCPHPAAGSLAVSPGGVRAVGLADGRVVLHHPDRGIVADIQAHQGPITALAWAQGGRLLVSGGKDWCVRAWRTHETR